MHQNIDFDLTVQNLCERAARYIQRRRTSGARGWTEINS